MAPEKYLTGAEWNWATVYTAMVETTLAGGTIDNFVRGGLAENFIKMSPLGPAVSEAGRKQFETTRDPMLAGDFPLLQGPLADNAGNQIVASGEALLETDVALESMNYLVEGVLGSTS